jgi:hypothetical protein
MRLRSISYACPHICLGRWSTQMPLICMYIYIHIYIINETQINMHVHTSVLAGGVHRCCSSSRVVKKQGRYQHGHVTARHKRMQGCVWVATFANAAWADRRVWHRGVCVCVCVFWLVYARALHMCTLSSTLFCILRPMWFPRGFCLHVFVYVSIYTCIYPYMYIQIYVYT